MTLQNPAAIRATKTVISPSLVSKGFNKFQPTSSLSTRLPTLPLPLSMTTKSSAPIVATKTILPPPRPPLGQSYGQTTKLSVSFSSLVPPPPPSSLTTSARLGVTSSLSSALSSASSQGTPVSMLNKKSSASSSSYL